MWVAMLTCASFVIAGIAIALHPFVSATTYRWFMVLLLAVMTAIPLWVAVGHGARSCGSDAGGLSGETSCRVGFGIGAAILVLMLTIALGQALRGGDDPS